MSFSLADFIPFSVDSWFGLYQTVNSLAWPWHLAIAALALLSVFLAFIKNSRIVGRQRIALTSLGFCWFSVAWSFFFGEYASLSWAATWFGWLFVLQGILLIGAGIIFRLRGCMKRTGYAAAPIITGLIGIPLSGLIEGRTWQQLDWLGIGPDSTALFSLGVLLAIAPWSTVRILSLVVLPLTWTCISAATAWPMGLLQGLVPIMVVMVMLIWLVFRTTAGSDVS